MDDSQEPGAPRPAGEALTLSKLDTLRRSAIDGWFSSHYSQLQQLASRELRGERSDHTLEPTALVHELFLRLRRFRKVSWETTDHFLNLSARLMRQILIDSGRSHRRKRGSIVGAVESRETSASGPAVTRGSLTRPASVRMSLGRLAEIDPTKVAVVELHFFGGLSVEETAAALKISTATVVRHWRFAKAFLARELGVGTPTSSRS